MISFGDYNQGHHHPITNPRKLFRVFANLATCSQLGERWFCFSLADQHKHPEMMCSDHLFDRYEYW